MLSQAASYVSKALFGAPFDYTAYRIKLEALRVSFNTEALKIEKYNEGVERDFLMAHANTRVEVAKDFPKKASQPALDSKSATATASTVDVKHAEVAKTAKAPAASKTAKFPKVVLDLDLQIGLDYLLINHVKKVQEIAREAKKHDDMRAANITMTNMNLQINKLREQGKHKEAAAVELRQKAIIPKYLKQQETTKAFVENGRAALKKKADEAKAKNEAFARKVFGSDVKQHTHHIKHEKPKPTVKKKAEVEAQKKLADDTAFQFKNLEKMYEMYLAQEIAKDAAKKAAADVKVAANAGPTKPSKIVLADEVCVMASKLLDTVSKKVTPDANGKLSAISSSDLQTYLAFCTKVGASIGIQPNPIAPAPLPVVSAAPAPNK